MRKSFLAALAATVMITPVPVRGADSVPAKALELIGNATPARTKVDPAKPRRLLVLNLTRGFYHSSIPYAAKALEMIGKKTGAWKTLVTDDISFFEPARLKGFDAVCFNNTTGELFLPPGFDRLTEAGKKKAVELDERLKNSLLDFVNKGGGLVGIHAATDCFYEWPEFGRMMGGYFNGHPWNEKVWIKLDAPGHPLCAAFSGKGFEIKDEIYTFKAPFSRDELKVLVSLDRKKTTRKGNRPDDDYALAWIREQGKGRVFYCGFGHGPEIFQRPDILRFLLDGVQYALGDLAADATPGGRVGPADIWMGEYAGTWKPERGRPAEASGMIVAEGGGRYRAVLRGGKEPVELKGRISGRDLSLARVTFRDYVTDWGIAGPYFREGVKADDLLDTGFPPEEKDAAVEWRRFRPSDPMRPWMVDLSAVVGGENRAAYLKCEFESSASGQAYLALGSDDGVKAWLNGRLVHANNAFRGLEPEQDEVKVRLRKGGNTLMLKISQGGGGWAACAAVRPLNKQKLKGLGKGRREGGSWQGKAGSGLLTAVREGRGAGEFSMKRVERTSPTIGRKPPAGAVALIPLGDGPPSFEEWDNPNWRGLPGGVAEVRKGDNRTRRKFGDIELHVEFMIPYMPFDRGQGRGNSGVYLQDRYEVQVLDSFGLEPKDNECGGIYKTAVPRENASLPPLTWQTYDIVFKAPRLKRDGSVESYARVSVRHNGVLIHEDVEVPKATGGGAEGIVARGPIKLQDHGNPVRYRNVWVKETDR